jgi:pyruvate dehydrogenase E1 component
LNLVSDMTDADIWALKRGGHDYRKIYAAYQAAMNHKGQPTVIIAKTIKGYGLGKSFEGRNATHQMKKLKIEDLKRFRDEMRVPISDAELEKDPYMPPYFKPADSSPELQYMHDRRKQLGGYLPERRSKYVSFKLPEEKAYEVPRKGSGNQEVATTMAFVRMLKDVMKAEETGQRIQLIIPDEARTFGMDAFFPTSMIYNPHGQHYMSVDRELLLSYKESEHGQILHTGINEAGSIAAFTASGSSYATHGQPIIPIYVFYSMFGFQRTADSIWLAGDQMVRGFMIGATAGRTTLTGEGLQHADGHSPVIASTNAAVISYDPAYGYEIAHITKAGLERMYGGSHPDPNVMYYITVYNEPMVQPAEPANLDVDGLLKGIYLLNENSKPGLKAQILASGVAVPWALEAQHLLADWGVSADIWSVTSWVELRRDGIKADDHNFLQPDAPRATAYVTQKLAKSEGPFLGVSDYTHTLQDMIRPWVPGDYATLGADGFGFSDTRPAARRYFKIDGPSIAVRVLQQLVEQGKLDRSVLAKAIEKYRLHDVSAGTSGSAGGDA